MEQKIENVETDKKMKKKVDFEEKAKAKSVEKQKKEQAKQEKLKHIKEEKNKLKLEKETKVKQKQTEKTVEKKAEKASNTKKTVKLKGTEMIVVVINRGYSDFVVDAARDAGATGATILTGRSENKEKGSELAGIKIATEKEIVLIVVPKAIRKKVMKQVSARTHVQERGNGICFCVPVNDVRGLIEFDELT